MKFTPGNLVKVSWSSEHVLDETYYAHRYNSKQKHGLDSVTIKPGKDIGLYIREENVSTGNWLGVPGTTQVSIVLFKEQLVEIESDTLELA